MSSFNDWLKENGDMPFGEFLQPRIDSCRDEVSEYHEPAKYVFAFAPPSPEFVRRFIESVIDASNKDAEHVPSDSCYYENLIPDEPECARLYSSFVETESRRSLDAYFEYGRERLGRLFLIQRLLGELAKHNLEMSDLGDLVRLIEVTFERLVENGQSKDSKRVRTNEFVNRVWSSLGQSRVAVLDEIGVEVESSWTQWRSSANWSRTMVDWQDEMLMYRLSNQIAGRLPSSDVIFSSNLKQLRDALWEESRVVELALTRAVPKKAQQRLKVADWAQLTIAFVDDETWATCEPIESKQRFDKNRATKFHLPTGQLRNLFQGFASSVDGQSLSIHEYKKLANLLPPARDGLKEAFAHFGDGLRKDRASIAAESKRLSNQLASHRREFSCLFDGPKGRTELLINDSNSDLVRTCVKSRYVFRDEKENLVYQ